MRKPVTALGQALLCPKDALDEPEQKRVCGVGHLSVVVAVEFHESGVRVTDDLHHPPEVGVFLVAPEHLQIPVASNQQKRRPILPRMKKRSHMIDDGLFSVDATLGAHGEVSDRVAAVRDEPDEFVRIGTELGQPAYIQPYQDSDCLLYTSDAGAE